MGGVPSHGLLYFLTPGQPRQEGAAMWLSPVNNLKSSLLPRSPPSGLGDHFLGSIVIGEVTASTTTQAEGRLQRTVCATSGCRQTLGRAFVCQEIRGFVQCQEKKIDAQI